MPTYDSKTYLELKGKLERLSVGIKKHLTDTGFPSNISAEAVDARLAYLVQTRDDYEAAANLAHQKSEVYSNEFDQCDDLFSRISTQLYGIYGKQNLIVEDYGLRTYQKPQGRKPKAESAAAK